MRKLIIILSAIFIGFCHAQVEDSILISKSINHVFDNSDTNDVSYYYGKTSHLARFCSDEYLTISNMTSDDCATMYINWMQTDSCLTNVISELGKRGEICKVFGHHWKAGRQGEGEIMSGVWVYLSDFHPYTEYRTCKICGKCESRDTREIWK